MTRTLTRMMDGGAIEGAERDTRETLLWNPSMRSADAIINPIKELADARARDTDRNDGFVHGAVGLNKDNIVGSQYRLIAQPHTAFLATLHPGFDDTWAEEFQTVVEARFALMSESSRCYFDAMGINTLTGLLRLAIGIFVLTGEYVGSVEWIRNDPSRPIQTAVQTISPDRLCNPDDMPDSRTMRRGITRDVRGRPMAYSFRLGDKMDAYADSLPYTWRTVPVAKPWGRTQVIHILEQNTADQSRGISDLVTALKKVRMLRRFSDVALQSAVVNASYAATIESDLDSSAVAMALGGGQPDGRPEVALLNLYRAHLGAIGAFMGEANNVRIDGATVPHLPPNTKLNLTPVKESGGLGGNFEESLMRYVAASLGMSYEALSRDFSKTNYSSGRAALGVQNQFMQSRKKHVADRLASEIYALVLEEEMAAGNVPLPAGVSRDVFYEALAKEALTRCAWIGTGAGQIDPVRETEAAMMRIRAGLSTHAIEIAALGGDAREIFAQLEREQADAKRRNLTFDLTTAGSSPPPAEEPTTTPTPANDPAPTPARRRNNRK